MDEARKADSASTTYAGAWFYQGRNQIPVECMASLDFRAERNMTWHEIFY